VEHYTLWDQNLTFMNSFFYTNFKSQNNWELHQIYHNKTIELFKNIIYSAQSYQQMIYDKTIYLLDAIEDNSKIISGGMISCFIFVFAAINFGYQAYDRKIFLLN